MSASEHEATRLDICRFLRVQSKERYQSFVIYGPPLIGKTRLARQLAEIVIGSVYLDFLAYVVGHPELARRIDTLDVASVQKIVVNYASEKGAKLLLVDELDFLIHTWEPDLVPFKYMISSLSVTQTPTTIGFLVQTYPALEAWHLPNTERQNRILNMETIQAL